MKQSRKSFTLVEVLVSLTLFAVVLTTIFSLYKHNSLYLKELSRARKEAEALHIAQGRLTQVFLHLEFGHGKSAFYSSDQKSSIAVGNSLVFTFNNGTDASKYFSNSVIGKLFLDNEKRLSLALWPDAELFPTEEKTMRKEILLENVQKFAVSFWAPATIMDKKATEDAGIWVNEWKKEYKSLPTLIKLNLLYKPHEAEKTIELYFVVAKKTPLFKL